MSMFTTFVDAEDDDNNGDEPNKKKSANANPYEDEQKAAEPGEENEPGSQMSEGPTGLEDFPLVSGPMPQKASKTRYPFELLEVGQGRRICLDEEKARQRVYSAKCSYQKKHHKEFEVRRRAGYVELWRTK